MSLIEITDLTITLDLPGGPMPVVRDVSLSLERGEALGIVGESGSGKSMTALALMRLLPRVARVKAKTLGFDGLDLTSLEDARFAADIAGPRIGMIFQEPMTSLNPVYTIGRQMTEGAVARGMRPAQAREKAVALLDRVGIPDADARMTQYPHQMSGGQRQRVMIAMTLMLDPDVLIADEPTTGLDITTQKAVMDLMRDLIRARGMSSILITHDLGLASEYCDRIVVMKDGQLVEQGAPQDLFVHPKHPYTQRLVDATPRLGATIRSLLPVEARRPEPEHKVHPRALLEAVDLTRTFASKSGPVRAVKGISFQIREGQSVGLVGESGSGKSTTAEMLVRLSDPTSGHILFEGQDIAATPAARFSRTARRRDIQMVFQDATDALNPRHTAATAIAEPLRRIDGLSGRALRIRVEELAELTGLPLPLLNRLPHQLSGGQKARVGIARAIALEPKLLILDEPTAALDVSIQALVLNLLVDLRARLGMSYLFVSHDLNVVRLLCDEVLVMKSGEIIERGPAAQVMANPQHPYTRSLVAAAPQPPETPVAA